MDAKKNTNKDTYKCSLNDGTPLEQGEYYTDGVNRYVLFDVQEPYAIVYKNPPAMMLWSDIFKKQKEEKIPLLEFKKFHVAVKEDKAERNV